MYECLGLDVCNQSMAQLKRLCMRTSAKVAASNGDSHLATSAPSCAGSIAAVANDLRFTKDIALELQNCTIASRSNTSNRTQACSMTRVTCAQHANA